MTNNIDFLYAFVKVLDGKFPDFKLMIDQNEADIEKPSLFVDVRHLTTDSYFRFNRKIINVVITFVSDKKIDLYGDIFDQQEELLYIQNQLDVIFDTCIKINGISFPITNKTFLKGKDALILTLSFDFLEEKAEENLPDMDKYSRMMEELKLLLKDR